MKIPEALLAEDICAYTDEGHEKKEAFHRAGRKFLKALATAAGLQPGQYDIRSNKGGIAVSGEVTLHADHAYVQLSESAMHRGGSVLYRTCEGRKDYTGGTNHWQALSVLARSEDAMDLFVEQVQKMAQGQVAADRPRMRG